jgi:predicted solute-binding protein
MWCSFSPSPLILLVWAYNVEQIGGDLAQTLLKCRDHGLKHLSSLAQEVSATTDYDSQFVQDYLGNGWSYHIGRDEQNALKLLEDYAVEYQLIQHRRLDKVLARQA